MVEQKSDVTRIQAAPGGSRGVTGGPTDFGGTRKGDAQAHGVDRVTPGLPPGAFGEERARIKCEPYQSGAPQLGLVPDTPGPYSLPQPGHAGGDPGGGRVHFLRRREPGEAES